MKRDVGAQAQYDGQDDSSVNGASRYFPSTSRAAYRPCRGPYLLHGGVLNLTCRMLEASG